MKKYVLFILTVYVLLYAFTVTAFGEKLNFDSESDINSLILDEYRAAVKNSTSYLDKVSKAFSPEFADELWSAQMEVLTLECQNYYRMGFRLGFQLALEGMSTD